MSKTSFTMTALASIFLLAAASFGASTAANAQQQPLQDQFKNEPTQEQGAQPDEASGLRAAQEVEEEFSDELAAKRADEEDNDPANTQKLMILDSQGRPYMYDGVRDGVVCRARRVPVRRNAWGTSTYRKTISCRTERNRPRYNQYNQPYQQQYNQYGQPYNPPYFRN